MNLILLEDHSFKGKGGLLGVERENISTDIVIQIEYDELLDKNAYLEFRLNDGTDYTTPRIPIEDKKIRYTLVNGIMKKGYLEFQVIFRNDENYVWKSLIKRVVVSDAICASDRLPEEYPDFISSAQSLLDQIVAEEQRMEQNEEQREINELIRIANEARREREFENYYTKDQADALLAAKVNKTQKINRKELTGDVNLDADDIGMEPVTTAEVDAMFN